MKVSYLGTTVLLFDDGRDQILFDCHVTRPSLGKYLFGKLTSDERVVERVMRDLKMDRLRGIFISHSHHDHVMDAPLFARRAGACIYGSPSALMVARGGGIPEERLFSYEDSLEYQVGEFMIKVIPSLHAKARWYKNDLGQTIDEPLIQPAPQKKYKEGGSFDFCLTHRGRTYLVRPSYNFIPGQLDGIRADVLFIGIAGIEKDSRERREEFFRETVERVKPSLVIPLHWDNFFTPLYGPVRYFSSPLEDTGKSMALLSQGLRERGVDCAVLLPLSGMEV